MIGWIIRFLLIISAFIAGWFVKRDALQFDVLQMIIAVFLFTILVAGIACWPLLKQWLSRLLKK